MGASQQLGSVGNAVLTNLLRGAERFELHAVNLNGLTIAGATCHTSLDTIPSGPSLAVIAIPARLVPETLRALAAKGVALAVIISAGLSRNSRPGRGMLQTAHAAGIRIIGPNCLGIILPHVGINASFASSDAPPGELALLSQSGAIASVMVEWAAPRDVGFSAIMSIGDMAQTGLDELVTFFAADPQTRAILIYMEGLEDGGAFIEAARAATVIKPVIVLKSGRGAAAGRAALSHTGALAGSWDVYRAAFREAGIVAVDSLDALFDAAAILDDISDPIGGRLAIVTNGGGAGVLALDAVNQLQATGAQLAALSQATIARLDAILPSGWSRANPLDIIGDADPERYRAAIAAVLADDGVDAVLAMNCPTGLLVPGEAAQTVAEVAGASPRAKPVLACWLGDANQASSREVFAKARIPAIATPEQAVHAFGYALEGHRARLNGEPARHIQTRPDAMVRGKAIIDAVLADGRAAWPARQCAAAAAQGSAPCQSRAVRHQCPQPARNVLTGGDAMDLLTQHLRERLLANSPCEADHVPVVKFFNPIGAATWLFTELGSDGDTLFGLCDLGFGFPELGSASLSEIASVRLPLDLGIERDVHFAAEHPLSVYAEAARLCGQITEHPDHLTRAAAALARAREQGRSRSPP